MDEETRQRIAMLEARTNEAHKLVDRLDGTVEALKKIVTHWENRLNRMRHFFRIGLDDEDPRSPLRRK